MSGKHLDEQDVHMNSEDGQKNGCNLLTNRGLNPLVYPSSILNTTSHAHFSTATYDTFQSISPSRKEEVN